MPLSDGFKRLRRWATSATATRTLPANATVAITEADGFPEAYSLDVGGTTPERGVMNEIYGREFDALADIRETGILPWDTAVDTLANGVKQRGGKVWRATVNTGPAYGNVTDPEASGQTVWAQITGRLTTPSAPGTPTATAGNGQLFIEWLPGLDGGSSITSFNLWHRSGGGSYQRVSGITASCHTLTGLPNGTARQFYVEAVTSQGTSSPSSTGIGTPVASVPAGGAQLALRGTTGNRQVELAWLEPENNGASIQSYTLQWRGPGQGFSTARQQIVAGARTYTVTNLTNPDAYEFRVAATNSVGTGAWSAITAPDQTVPGTPAGFAVASSTGRVVDISWTAPADDGGLPIIYYEIRIGTSGRSFLATGSQQTLVLAYVYPSGGDVVPPTSVEVTLAADFIGGAPGQQDFQTQVRAVNSVGFSEWSGARFGFIVA